MSNVYVLEPQTSGKVLLKTTVGDIDIELWAKETPKTCRNFIQLCLEGYYDNTIFHRVVKGFIVQGGDPNGDGTGGESIYDEPFADEFHQRLKFTRRGLLAMANAGENDNGSQFFFTLGPAAELQNKHTIFGKVVGDTIYNMLKLEEGLIENERPAYPHKIIGTEVLNNPFPDIIPRIKEVSAVVTKKKERTPGVKNYKLLSFGDEAEEEEEENIRENVKLTGKGKSTHDVLDDPKLSSKTVEPAAEKRKDDDDDVEEIKNEEEMEHQLELESIRKKLKKDHKKAFSTNTFIQRDKDEKREKVEAIQKEIKDVKREYHKNKLKPNDEQEKEEIKQQKEKNKIFEEYKTEYDKYKDKKTLIPKKGAEREKFTLQLLEKFKKKLQDAKAEEEENEIAAAAETKDDGDEAEKWMNHELHFKDDVPVLAKDANRKDDDWFEIYDPRNRLNKRRRGEIHTETN